MRRKMITVSAVLALMLSVAGCSDKAPKETTPAASATTIEAVNVTADDTTEAPATTLAEETPVVTVTTTVADSSTAETTTAPVTTAEINTPPETAPEETTTSVGPLTILSQPQDAYVIPDSNTRFTIEATSEKPISYLWEYRMNENDTWKTSPHGGVTSKYHSVYVSKHTEWDGVQFRCIVCEPGGTPIYSEPATLHIITPLTTEYFPDEGFRRLVSEFDQDQDGNLSPEEREAVTKIQCSTGYSTSDDVISIHSLAGIQYFSELEVLFCSDLDLAELDVSHNRKLTELYCNNNKLTALDLSNNDALSQLECYNNQLTSLDLRANQKLQGLNCVANSLSAITLPKHSRLTSVKCFCNPSLEINANNCSSPDDMNYVIIFFIDATASISNQRDDGHTIFRLEKRYDHAPLEDGYYSAELIEKDEIDDYTEDYYCSGYGYSIFTGATADQDTLTIQDARLFTSILGYSYSYDCGTISLPLAQTVRYEYMDIYGETSDYTANDFNTFYSAMIEEYKSCFSEDTSGDLYLSIHIFNGSIDEISIQIDQYP